MRNRLNDEETRPTKRAGLPVGVGWIGRLGVFVLTRVLISVAFT
jgi:hypothetical protein